MAKGKKGPALFEVIRAAQQKQAEQQRKLELAKTQQPSVLGNAAVRLMSPGYWFGSKEKQGAEAAVAKNDAPVQHFEPARREVAVEAPRPAARPMVEPAAKLQPVLREVPATQPYSATSQASPVEQAPVQREVVRFDPAPPARTEDRHAFDDDQHADEPVTITRPAFQSPARPVVTTISRDTPASSPADDIARRVREEIAAASRMKDTYDDVSPDPVFNSVSDLFGSQNQEEEDSSASRRSFKFKMPFQLNYTTGLVAGVAVLLVLGVSLIAINAGNKDDAKVAAAKPRPDVLVDVRSVNNGSQDRSADNTAVARANTPPNTATAVLDTTPIKPPTNVKRVVGQQYVVLLSFPPTAEKEAKELVKFLADNGVATTAERALPGYSPSWFSVLTTRGFERTRDSADFDQFNARLVKLMEKYAKGSKFKTFKPDVYRWRTAS